MTPQAITLKDLKNKVLKDVKIKPNDLEIPYVEKIDEYYENLEGEKKRDFKQMIIEKVVTEALPLNSKALVDNKLKNKVREQTQIEFNSRCNVCCSPYFPIYNEWLILDNRSYAECYRVALVAFGEEVSPKSFSNHKRHHLHETNLIRKIMIMENPNADPMKVGQGLLQIVVEDIIQDEIVNPKKIKTAKDLIKVIGDIEKNRAKHSPFIDNSQINITQVNDNRAVLQGIPNAEDTKQVLLKPMSEKKKQRLKELQSKWKNKGSNKIKNLIPKSPPVVKKDKNVIDAELVEDE